MRSRPARLTLSALAWIGIGTAAFLASHLQQQITLRRAALRAFEATSRDSSDALGDAQAGQQAYVAPGQDAREWEGKVATYLQTASAGIDTLRMTAQSAAAGPSLLDSSTALTQIRNIDGRLRQRVAGGGLSDASAVVFTEAAAAFSSAVSDIDTALGAERQAAELFESMQQRFQVYALGGAAGVAALVIAVLGFAGPGARRHETSNTLDDAPAEEAALLASESAAPASIAGPADRQSDSAGQTASIEALQHAAHVCAGFGKVRDASDLKPLLEQAAGALNARGLIVWLGSPGGADLRPVLAHGYTDATLARISTIARAADNAAACAYRTATLQIVKSRPGGSQGAVVAPLVGPDGCIGALTAEIRDRQEESDTTRALAEITASQLAAVLAPAAASADDQAATAAGG
jgi:hypothetical protein